MSSGYLLVIGTVFLTVYGQVAIKWQILKMGSLPEDFSSKVLFFTQLLLNPLIISALAAAFLASITWMAAMTKLPLSQGYPLTSLSFVLIILLGSYIFNEPLSTFKIVGMGLILAGIACVSHD
jgi:multidrug transporter EmrE-like cation transporter